MFFAYISFGSDGKKSACNAGDEVSVPGSGRSPEEGIGYPLQDSCLENSIDRGTCWATVHGEPKSWTRLSNSLAWEDGGAKYVQGYQRKEMKQVVRGAEKGERVRLLLQMSHGVCNTNYKK